MTADSTGDGGEQLERSEHRGIRRRHGRRRQRPRDALDGASSSGSRSPSSSSTRSRRRGSCRWSPPVRCSRSSATGCASSSARTPGPSSGCSATRPSSSALVSIGVIGPDHLRTTADRVATLPFDRARPAARWRDRQPDRPIPPRLRRRLGRHRHRRHPLLHVQRRRRGDQPRDRDAHRPGVPADARRAWVGAASTDA